MKKLGIPIRVAIGLAALLFLFTFKLPFWVIYLTAPQYPEGLSLYIYLHKISGDIEIINGLNHYIGMAIIDESDFKEFVFLPFIIAGITAFGLLTSIIGSKKMLYGWTVFLLVFSMLAIYDFWRWEYTYGHNLDPDAAIQVPGMSYQPPLIGYKQLLNFGAYSYPHGGGWFYIGGVVIACIVSIIVWRKSRKLSSLK